jgi:hypothetical protein
MYTRKSSFTRRRLIATWSQSYDFGIYNYNASFVVGQIVLSKYKKLPLFSKRTRLLGALLIFTVRCLNTERLNAKRPNAERWNAEFGTND